LLENYGFEGWGTHGPSGPPDSWRIVTFGMTASQEDVVVFDGLFSTNLTWTSTSTQLFTQEVPIVLGETYRMAVRCYDDDPGGRIRLYCYWLDAFGSRTGTGIASSYSVDMPDWQVLEVPEMIAPPNAVAFEFTIRLYDEPGWPGTATVYVDVAELCGPQPTPTPATGTPGPSPTPKPTEPPPTPPCPPGYELVKLVAEPFETWPLPGWNIVNNGGVCVWRPGSFDVGFVEPNLTGGLEEYADADSDDCGLGNPVDTELWTPEFSLAGAIQAELSLRSDMNWVLGGGSEFWDIDITTDGAVSWTNLLHRQGADYPGPEVIVLDLSPYAGYPSVRLRFHYGSANGDGWWQIDDVTIMACVLQPTATPPPPTNTPAPPTSTPLPPTYTPVPPTSTPVPPTDTPVPPTNTPVPPTDTPVPPTDTPVPPTNTPVPPTSTPAPPTDTPAPPTNTPIPPTDTPVPPTSTPAPPTDTPVPPTGTPIPPTATPAPPTGTPAPPSPTPDLSFKGDIDGNGRINTSDANLCFQIAMGMYSPTPEEFWRADVDMNGRVTTSDAICIFQEALGIPNDCFPVGGLAAFTMSLDPNRRLLRDGALALETSYLDEQGLIAVTVVLDTGSQTVDNLQFDLAYDPAVLHYRDGDFRSEELLVQWPLFEDNLLRTGHLRFGGLSWEQAIPSQTVGGVVTFYFQVIGEGRLGLRLFYLDGGIEGFNVR
jgi:hypothetical protein